MPSVFDKVRAPAQYKNILRHYPFGAHWPHATDNLLSYIVVAIAENLVTHGTHREAPRLQMQRARNARNKRTLILTVPTYSIEIDVVLGDVSVRLGDELIEMNSPDAPMILINKIIDRAVAFWESQWKPKA